MHWGPVLELQYQPTAIRQPMSTECARWVRVHILNRRSAVSISVSNRAADAVEIHNTAVWQTSPCMIWLHADLLMCHMSRTRIVHVSPPAPSCSKLARELSSPSVVVGSGNDCHGAERHFKPAAKSSHGLQYEATAVWWQRSSAIGSAT